MGSKHRHQKTIQAITTHRMEALFRFAEQQEHLGHSDRSHRYMDLVHKLSTKNRTPLPNAWKHRRCKHCHRFLIPGKTCRVRIHRHKVILFCTQCAHYRRIPLKTREQGAAILI